jgi:cellulose synthase/poly-beta-1,6-N-acetylglucosamine synthase-like glycosyltransferase
MAFRFTTETVARRERSGARPTGDAAVGRRDDRPLVAVTVIVPAYNEAATVAETIRSLQTQTVVPAEIVVVDDCSEDRTGEVAAAAGATVIRPDANTGSKAGAQTFALDRVRTTFTMAIDADTTLAPDAIERLLEAFADKDVVAASGFVLPQRVRTPWERGRYVEYLFSFGFLKQVQDFYGVPLISSGCFSMYRTDQLRRLGGWSGRTLAEDMDLTWSAYQAGLKVRFIPTAVCYPLEPHNYRFMRAQLRRWSHGFVQNVQLHWRGILPHPFLRSMVAVACWDAVIGSLAFLVVLPLLIALLSPWFALGYVIDGPALLVPIVFTAMRRRELVRALVSFPCFYPLRLLNALIFVRAVLLELVFRRPLLVYEKGH